MVCLEPEEKRNQPTGSLSNQNSGSPGGASEQNQEKRSFRGLEDNFELLKQTFADLLIQDGSPAPKEVPEIEEITGCSQPTIRKWIKILESAGLIEREAVSKGRGRPSIQYRPTAALFQSVGMEPKAEPISSETNEAKTGAEPIETQAAEVSDEKQETKFEESEIAREKIEVPKEPEEKYFAAEEETKKSEAATTEVQSQKESQGGMTGYDELLAELSSKLSEEAEKPAEEKPKPVEEEKLESVKVPEVIQEPEEKPKSEDNLALEDVLLEDLASKLSEIAETPSEEKTEKAEEEKTEVQLQQPEEKTESKDNLASEDTLFAELVSKLSEEEEKPAEEKAIEEAPESKAPEVQPEPEQEEKTESKDNLAEDELLADLASKLSEAVEEPAEEKPKPPEEEKPEPVEVPEVQPKVEEKPESQDSLSGDDALLADLASKLEDAAGKSEAPAAEPRPKFEGPKPEAIRTEIAPSAPAAAQAAESRPQEQVESSDIVQSISTTADSTVQELWEQLTKVERIKAPQDFYEFCSFEPPAGYQELERYWIEKPFIWASILYSPERNERAYFLVEPSLTPGEKTALEMLHDHLLDRLTYDERIKDRDRLISNKVNELLHEYGLTLTANSIKKLLYYLKRNYIGYGRINGLLMDNSIEDISCDGVNVPLFVYSRRYQSLRTNIVFTESNELDLFVIRLVERAGKQITLGKPTVDASLPEGYRIQATLGTEVTTKGSSYSIRKYGEDPFTPIDLLSYGTFSSEMLAYIWLATENKKNIINVGGTASGKTSTLNAISMFIWPDAKIVSIEDTRELALYQENWVPSVTRPAPGERAIDMYDLLRQALRQRPEVIIVGEVRGKEALTMFQAMSTGHTCYSTMHAGSIQEMVHRLEGEPINVPHHMLAALDIVCLQLLTYYRDQRVRRNQSVVEIASIDPATGALRTNRVFERNPLTDEFERVGESHLLREIAKERGWSALELEQELRRRQQVLEFMYKNNVRRLHEVASILRQYYFEPEKVMEQIVTGKLKA